jgi:hypothetical protein
MGTDIVRKMPDDEQTTPQVQRIFELLVKPHPDYFNFRIEDDWGFAQKRDTGQSGLRMHQREVVTEVKVEKVYVGLGAVLGKAMGKLRGK